MNKLQLLTVKSIAFQVQDIFHKISKIYRGDGVVKPTPPTQNFLQHPPKIFLETFLHPLGKTFLEMLPNSQQFVFPNQISSACKNIAICFPNFSALAKMLQDWHYFCKRLEI